MPRSSAAPSVDMGLDCHEGKSQIYCHCLHFVWINIPFTYRLSVWFTRIYVAI